MIGGRYSLDHEIGRGGMGVVWLGTDHVLNRTVAIKRLGMRAGDTSPDALRADREARISARINHPNVVAVFDMVVEDGIQWLVMEHVEGRSLADQLRSGGAMDPDQAAPLLAQVADALTAAHEAGVVHRDVKPSNVLVTADGTAKLSDFGVARGESDEALTQTGLVTGSPAYLAPEVAAGRSATSAGDVWSLGATAYHVLHGRPPYQVRDGGVIETMHRIVHSEPPAPESAGALTALIESTMDRDPQARWSMDEVARFLHEGAAPTTTRAVPVASPDESDDAVASDVEPAAAAATATPGQRAGERSPSSRWLVAVLAAAVIAAFVGGFWLLAGGADDDSGDVASPTPEASASASGGADPSASPEPTLDPLDMESFAIDYVSTADADPAAGFEMLTPEYQRESGGLEGYEEFWDQVAGARIESGPSADADEASVTYTYTYRYGRGDEVESRREQVVLQLELRDGTYLIAGADASPVAS